MPTRGHVFIIGTHRVVMTQPSPDSTYDLRWRPGPARPVIESAAAHVWLIDLDVPRHGSEAALSAQERLRLGRFRSGEDARRWGRAHGAARSILARYLQVAPASLRFGQSTSGKPHLAHEGAPSFNLSHSGALAVLAVADGEIGVDVELARPRIDEVAIARRAIGDAAADRLALLSPGERTAQFLTLWTRHEAHLKLLGEGLGGTGLARSQPEPSIAELRLGPGAAGAVATWFSPVAVDCWRYT